ncbi:hypothetical protein EON64_20510, partial [archaeon]
MLPDRSWNAHSLPVRDVVIGEGGGSRRLWSCAADRALCLLDLQSGAQLLRLHLAFEPSALLLAPLGDQLVV